MFTVKTHYVVSLAALQHKTKRKQGCRLKCQHREQRFVTEHTSGFTNVVNSNLDTLLCHPDRKESQTPFKNLFGLLR